MLAAANALARLLDNSTSAQEHIREVIEREHDADNITHEVLQTVMVVHGHHHHRDPKPGQRSASADRTGWAPIALDALMTQAG